MCCNLHDLKPQICKPCVHFSGIMLSADTKWNGEQGE